jgi:hypothetical protein
MDRRMIDADAAFGHYFLQVAQAQAIAQIPAHAQRDHRLLEMRTFEHCQSPRLPEINAMSACASGEGCAGSCVIEHAS